MSAEQELFLFIVQLFVLFLYRPYSSLILFYSIYIYVCVFFLL